MMESKWEPTAINNKPEEYSSNKEREARSVALEKAYVHDVYEQIACHFTDSRYRPWPKVKQFLLDLEPGSIVCDVGCGNGKYLSFNPSVYKIGLDRCSNLTSVARTKDHEVLVCDNLALPFRDECFDAVLSIAVIHHFATTERRVAALKELARVLRIGGRLMVSVWAMEQRHRKFESQDVLVPWNRPLTSQFVDKTSSIERDLNSTTTTTSDDDATHYHAYTQTSDSDSFPSLSVDCRKRGRARHKGRSIDPTCPSSSQSSSDLSSPNESCYSFVRRALQKLAGTKRNRGGRRPWFLQGLDIPQQEGHDPLVAMEDDVGGMNYGNVNNPAENFMPIELRQLESTEFAELLQLQQGSKYQLPRGLFSNVPYPRRRRTLETTGELQANENLVGAQPKSKSLSDLFGLLPVSLLRSAKKSTEDIIKGREKEKEERAKQVARSHSSLSDIISPNDDEIEFPDCVRHKAVQTESLESIDLKSSSAIDSQSVSSTSNTLTPFHTGTCSPGPPEPEKTTRRVRPTLVKQKHSVCSPSTPHLTTTVEVCNAEDSESLSEVPCQVESSDISEDNVIPWREIKQSVKDLPEFKQPAENLPGPKSSSGRAGLTGSNFWKQTSLNEELIFSERLKEKQRLKQNIQKQCSLNDELMYKQRENTRWDQMKEAFLNSSNVKCLQLLKHGISSRFQRSDPNGNTVVNNAPGAVPSVPRQPYPTSSLRNGLVRMLQNWKQGEETGAHSPGENSTLGATRRGSKEGNSRRGLFPPFFLRRSSAGSLNVSKIGKDLGDHSGASHILSPPPYLKRRPSENELVNDGINFNGSSNKLIPGVRHVRKLSREEGSDSSKDSSFQSDTSVDSEDSFASVIFIPNKASSMDNSMGGGDPSCFSSETRANSTDSDRSPKSPASRLSPPSHNVPKSPSPLASEILKKRSPEVSPTRVNVYGSSVLESSSKFVFDESTTTVAMSAIACSSSEYMKSLKQDVGGLPSLKEEPSSPIEPSSVVVVKKQKCEKIEVLRKPAVLPEQRHITRQMVRRSLPKALAVELYNPETDDADTSDTSSSSPDSVSSVVSVVNDDGWNATNNNPQTSVESDPQHEFAGTEVPTEEIVVTEDSAAKQPVLPEPYSDKTEGKTEEKKKLVSASSDPTAHTVPSLEHLGSSQSSPKARRKFTLARLGSTSEWLSSLPSDLTQSSSKRQPTERRTAGEKILMGEAKKLQPKCPDAKWPSSITDESPQGVKPPEEPSSASTHPIVEPGESHDAAVVSAVLKLGEELDEKDSLYDSMENLTNNPSVDSSVRMSSTCSCSIRGGDSFDSWTSAKSSLTNSSSNHHYKTSFPSLLPLQAHSKPPSLNAIGSGRLKGPGSGKSSAASEDAEDSTALTYHRYYHVFREGELDKLIEKYVQNLHIISSYYDHANWCIVAEKVQVWTI